MTPRARSSGPSEASLVSTPRGLKLPVFCRSSAFRKARPPNARPSVVRGEERRPVQTPGDHRRGCVYIWVYSGPSPPSGGVSRPPFAEIAPHWTQFEAVTSTSTTFPAGLASPAIS